MLAWRPYPITEVTVKTFVLLLGASLATFLVALVTMRYSIPLTAAGMVLGIGAAARLEQMARREMEDGR